MKQMAFADAEYASKRKQTRKALFLIEMDQVVSWQGLIALIEPHYPKGEGGRPAYSVMAMLRVHLMQNWFGYSDFRRLLEKHELAAGILAVINRQFGYVKVRFRGLAKNTAQLVTLFALSNLWMACRYLLASSGEVRP
ncbi:TPA: transposase [Pseudomonas aeruginosa]|nr:transposase [Pseudomonas aeruginosa]